MRNLLIFSSLAMAAAANAVTFDSFYNVTLHGVVTTASGNDRTVMINAGAYLTYGGNDYTIENGFGFYSLGKSVDITPSFSGGTQFTNWKYDENSHVAGSIAGWEDPSKKVPILTPGGGGLIFEYTTSDASLATGYGYHLTLDRPLAGSGTDGTTFFVTGNPVPEPASFAVLGLGLLGLVRRRKNG